MSDDEPIGYRVLRRGTPVVTSDGVEIGTVARVLSHERENIFDGIVIATGDGKRFVDAPEIALLTRRRVELAIDSEAARSLPEPAGIRESLETGARRSLRRLRRKLPGG